MACRDGGSELHTVVAAQGGDGRAKGGRKNDRHAARLMEPRHGDRRGIRNLGDRCGHGIQLERPLVKGPCEVEEGGRQIEVILDGYRGGR